MPTMRPSDTATSAGRAGAPLPSISEPPRITMSPSTVASFGCSSRAVAERLRHLHRRRPEETAPRSTRHGKT